MATTPSGKTWRGRWQKNDIVAKEINVREVTNRALRDFQVKLQAQDHKICLNNN